MRLRVLAYCLAALLLASPALAGQLTPPGSPGPTMKSLSEIEPRKPISILPFIIIDSGSYYLTGNLQVSDVGGVFVTADNVTIDLGGFTISGNGQGGQSATGVFLGASSGVTIRNGTITGFAGYGVYGLAPSVDTNYTRAEDITLEDLAIIANGLDGVNLYSDVRISRCRINRNGGDGVAIDSAAIIESSIARSNGGDGFQINFSGRVLNSAARANGGRGFSAGTGVVLSGCASRDNDQGGYSLAQGNIASECSSMRDQDSGFSIGSRNTLERVSASSTEGRGVLAGQGNIVKDSTFHSSAQPNAYGADCIIQNVIE